VTVSSSWRRGGGSSRRLQHLSDASGPLSELARQQAVAAREAAKPSFADKMIQSAARSAATSVGRQVAGKMGGQLLRGLLGGLFK